MFDHNGPVAIRYPRGGEGAFREDTAGETAVCLRQGTDVTLLAHGILINNVLRAADLLAERGISAQVIKLNRISPLGSGEIAGLLGSIETLLVAEDSFGAGCAGQRLAAMLAQEGKAPKHLILKNLGKTYAPEGSVAELERSFGLDAESLAAAAEEAVRNGQ